jgi:REP element-mobilizing transposase RayT
VTTRCAKQLRRSHLSPLWQRNYYDVIIRGEEALQQIRAYVNANPESWHRDQLHQET